MDDYKIQLPFFTGPFDLLLSLIKANEMDIYDVRIVDVVDQYLAYVDLLQMCDLEIAGEFLAMAATLMRLKSRTLLPESPYDKTEDDEELEEEVTELQSAKELIEQLVEYRKYKELSVPLGQLEESQARVHFRSKIGPIQGGEQAEEEVSGDLALLLKAFSRVLRVIDSQRIHQVVRETWTIDEKMDDIRRRLSGKKTLDVTKLFLNCVHKMELITVFLAVLELCKRRLIGLRQSVNFDRIEVYKREEQLDYVGNDESESE